MTNIWKQFENMLPKQSRVIGKIITVDELTKTCTIEQASGVIMTANGTGVIGNTYLIVGGIIMSEMPSLGDAVDVIIY